jgi:SAM-dependent methyltransferase
MKAGLSESFRTIIIDSSSPQPPRTADLVIPNNYYPGILRKAQEVLKESEEDWLFFISSDVEVDNFQDISLLFRLASKNRELGIVAPSVSKGSTFSFSLQSQQPYSQLREVGVVEGFCFLVRRDLFLELSIPETNRLGWGLDIELCFLAYKSGLKVVVDDRFKIFHPSSKDEHKIDKVAAQLESDELLGSNKLFWLQDVLTVLETKDYRVGKSVSLDLGSGKYPANPFQASKVIGIDNKAFNDIDVFEVDLFKGRIPFANSTFDYCTALDFIEHVPRVHQGFRTRFPFIELVDEIWRVLKPGGVFYALTPAFPESIAFRDPTHVNIITEETFPCYFCQPNLWASMYGFKGKFSLIDQSWSDGKLETFMRCIK